MRQDIHMNRLMIGRERSYQLVDLTNMTARECPLNITEGRICQLWRKSHRKQGKCPSTQKISEEEIYQCFFSFLFG